MEINTDPVSTAESVSPADQQPLVVSSRRLLVFDNGVPAMANYNLDKVNRNIVDRTLFAATMLPYKLRKIPDPTQTLDEIEDGAERRYIEDPDEEDYRGMTNGEVASIKMAEQAARGDYKIFKMINERIAGKAVEKNLNVSAKMDYPSWLASISGEVAEADGEPPNLYDML